MSRYHLFGAALLLSLAGAANATSFVVTTDAVVGAVAASTDATFRNTVHEPLGVASTRVRPAFSYAVLARQLRKIERYYRRAPGPPRMFVASAKRAVAALAFAK